MATLKDSILVLFQDNVMGGISAEDMRVFINAIFDSKENEVQVFERLQEVDDYRLSDPLYPIQQNDLVIITDHNNQNQITDRGLYLSPKPNPASTDLVKIANLNYDEFLKEGQNNQLISILDGELKWIEPLEGYYIEGTAEIVEILAKRPVQKGPVWIAKSDDLMAPVPGYEGDGYSWNGYEWVNVGQLRGPAGDVTEVAMATQLEVDGGYIDYKAVSPKTFENAAKWNTKEGSLGAPSENGWMLVSDSTGLKGWEKPVRFLNDVQDIEMTNVSQNDIIYYSGTKWENINLDQVAAKTFTSLSDTPTSYSGYGGYGVMVDGAEKSLTYTKLVTNTKLLDDWSTSTPLDGQTIRYNSTNQQWEPSANNMVGSMGTRPKNPETGTEFFDITLGIPIWYNGNTWINALGEIV